jgi:subtilisin family serine protease
VAQRLLEGTPSDRVRILITLAVDFQTEGVLTRTAIADQRGRIAAAAVSARAMLIGLGAEPSGFVTLPYVAAEVARGQIQAIASHPLVAAIDEDLIWKSALHESVPRIAAPPMWQSGYDGGGWTVAIVDTGVDGDHRLLAGKVRGEACFSTTGSSSSSLCPGGGSTSVGAGAGRPCPLDVGGCDHGTHVAGIAAGRDDQSRTYGAAPGASLLAVQVFSRFDDASLCLPASAPCALTYTSDFARGLDYVMNQAGAGNVNRIAAANLSIAGTNYSSACDNAPGMPAVKAAIDNLRSIGVPTVIAAGNDGNPGAISAPACISSSVSVGATDDSSDQLSAFSNRDPDLGVLAPGSVIYSSLPNNSYGFWQGTSMAAPHVSGAWAILKQVQPSASTGAILTALRSTGRKVSDSASGAEYSRINVQAAANALAPLQPPGPPVNLTASATGAMVTVTWQPPAGGRAAEYIVEAGSQPGTADVFNGTVGASLTASGAVPPGTYYLRARARNAAGSSPPSNEASVTVTSTGGIPPGEPQSLVSSVTGPTISISWAPPAGGGPVASYTVEAGSAPGLANLYAGSVGAGTTSISANAPPGTYYIRVRARNAGGISGPSNEVTAIVGSACSVPSAPVLGGLRSGNTVSLSWTVPAGGPVTHYVLQAGSSMGLSDLHNAAVGLSTAVSASVSPGTYHVRVIAHSGCGSGSPSNEFVVTVP